MSTKYWVNTLCASLAAASLILQPVTTMAQDGQDGPNKRLSQIEKIELLRSKVKYVFVIFHENESFDHYFGTYPGANGLFSAPPGATPAARC